MRTIRTPRRRTALAGRGSATATSEAGLTGFRAVVASGNGRYIEQLTQHLLLSGATVRKVAEPRGIRPLLMSFRPHILIVDDWFARQRVGADNILPAVLDGCPATEIVVAVDDAPPERVAIARLYGAVVMQRARILSGNLVALLARRSGRCARAA